MKLTPVDRNFQRVISENPQNPEKNTVKHMKRNNTPPRKGHVRREMRGKVSGPGRTRSDSPLKTDPNAPGNAPPSRVGDPGLVVEVPILLTPAEYEAVEDMGGEEALGEELRRTIEKLGVREVLRRLDSHLGEAES